jgi:N-acetylmuramoyl-L-alanine amidase
LATVQAVANKLESTGANVILTRTDDTYISLKQRADLSNQNNTDAFISIHYNWSNNPEINGLTDFYYTQSKDSSLASDLLNEVVKTTGLNSIGTKFDDLYVLRNNSKPSALIELGFLSNRQDEIAAENPSYNNLVAQGVYLGLLDYFSAKN